MLQIQTPFVQQSATSEGTTVLWAVSESSGHMDTSDYIDACRRLGLSPMVQPAKCRRCRSYSPSTEAVPILLP